MELKDKQEEMKERWSALRRHPKTKRLVPEDVAEQQEIEILCSRTDLKCPGCRTASVMANKNTGEVPYCKPCSIRNMNYCRNYKLNLREYNNRLVAQNNRCAVCLTEKEELVVDHCHELGHVRGLVCSSCNTLMGLAKDDEDILQNAIKYLKNNRIKGGWVATTLGEDTY